MQRLEDAQIAATCVREHTVGDLYFGGMTSMSVWIDDPQRLRQAAEILEQINALTEVDKCPRCKYDVQGHQGVSTCPECGHTLSAPAADVSCPKCHEIVPATFEICWSCGAELAPPS
ncbi:MAG: zinc ribbon domain-containing protein [Phycisphaerales bacterium]